jgi:acetylornithine/succinyldiaminopimelate/putrescine aminotransferase
MEHLSNRSLFFENLALTSDFPMSLEIQSAKGVFMFDAKGKSYIDFISGISVSNVGHGNSKVIDAIKNQADKHAHLMVYGEFIQSPQVKFAKLLSTTLPENLNSVFFTNSGTEAIEGATKLAKRATGRTQMISFKDSYHGSTHGALSLMGNEYFKQAFRPLLPDVKVLLTDSIDELNKITDETACVVIETLRGEAGAIENTKEFLEALRNKCTETGALLIFDEIQCGMGRTGKVWAFEHYGVVPDILATAKGLGGGMPLGAFISSTYLMKQLRNNPVLGHITTFGGHPICCAAGMAALELILTENWLQEIPMKEKLIRDTLTHPLIKNVRGKGLMLSAELESFEMNLEFIKKCVELGLITDWFLFCDSAFRIAPPLCISLDELKQGLGIIFGALNSFE